LFDNCDDTCKENKAKKKDRWSYLNIEDEGSPNFRTFV